VRALCLGLCLLLVSANAGLAQSDPFKNAQFTYMNIYTNLGIPRLGWQGVYNYGAADLVVQGNSTVGSPMVFKPNSLIYTGQSAPKQLRYYEALTLKEVTVQPGMSNASIVVNVTNVNIPTNTKFFVVCKTLSPSYAETSVQTTQITNTGRFTNTLSGLTNKVGNYLQVGFQMEGVTQTNTNSSQVGFARPPIRQRPPASCCTMAISMLARTPIISFSGQLFPTIIFGRLSKVPTWVIRPT
jgi:hypothetical protein